MGSLQWRRVSVGRAKAVGKILVGLGGFVFVVLAAGGAGIWIYPEVLFSEADPGPRMYAGACVAYGVDSPSCRTCRERGYDTCNDVPNARPKATTTQLTTTGLASETFETDCSSRPISDQTVEELRSIVDKASASNPKLKEVIGGTSEEKDKLEKQDIKWLQDFANPKATKETTDRACAYFVDRIKKLRAIDLKQAVADLDRLSVCLRTLSSSALEKSRKANTHQRVHSVARSFVNLQMKAQKAHYEVGESARHSQDSLMRFERDIQLCDTKYSSQVQK